MYKSLIAIATILLTAATLNTLAESNQGGSGSNGNSNTNSNGQPSGSGTPAMQGSQGIGATQPVQNQNQVKTQNAGEEQQLQVKTQEEQGEENDNKNDLSGIRSSVAQQIQKLLSTGPAAGGIGDQVREWAKAQNQVQTKIQENLANVENKGNAAKFLFGPDYKAIGELKMEMEQNRVRVQQLEQLKLKLQNQADITNVQEMIALINEENTALQERISLEEAQPSIFGWLMKLLVK